MILVSCARDVVADAPHVEADVGPKVGCWNLFRRTIVLFLPICAVVILDVDAEFVVEPLDHDQLQQGGERGHMRLRAVLSHVDDNNADWADLVEIAFCTTRICIVDQLVERHHGNAFAFVRWLRTADFAGVGLELDALGTYSAFSTLAVSSWFIS